jgi:hypothetical protein
MRQGKNKKQDKDKTRQCKDKTRTKQKQDTTEACEKKAGKEGKSW